MALTQVIHHTVGVYPNGSYKENGVLDELLESHIEYNRTFRFGRALFVDGKCVYPGFLSEEVLEKAKQTVANLKPIVKDTQPYH